MKPKPIFKERDTVYHYERGSGLVARIYNNEPDNGVVYAVAYSWGGELNAPEHLLSFTPYDLIKGGLTHEKPLTVGDVIYVWEGSDPKAVESGRYHSTLFGTFGITKNDGGLAYFSRWSRENPLLPAK